MVPRSWTHLLATVLDRDVDPGTELPAGWLELAAAARPGLTLPTTMSDGTSAGYQRWDAGDHHFPVDAAIAQVRGLVYPLYGLDGDTTGR